MRASWPLVGRAAELDFIAGELSRRGCGGVVVAGEPGVGKTRIAREALARLAPERFHHAWICASQSLASIPFGAMAPLLPEPSPQGAATVDNLRLFRQALASRAQGRIFVLGIDDVNLLDPASAGLVHQLVADSALKVVATLRFGVQAPDVIRALWKDELTSRLELKPLTAANAAEILESVLGGVAASDTVEGLHASTGGNPLFMRELVRDALESGSLSFRNGAWHCSWKAERSIWLEQLMAERLETLAPEPRHALELLAVGEPLPAPLVKRLVGSSVVESLSQSGLVMLSPAEPDQLRLSHPLYGQVVIAALGQLAARERNIELVRAMIATKSLAPADLLRAAVLSSEASVDLDAEVLTRASLAANARWAWELAEKLARRAIERGAGFLGGWALASALARLGRPTEALEHVAYLWTLDLDDRQRAQLARLEVAVLGDYEDIQTVQAAVERSVRSMDSASSRDLVNAEWAVILSTRGRHDEAASIAEPMVSDPSTDELARLRAVATAAFSWNRAGQLDRSLCMLEEMLATALQRVDDLPDAPHWVGGTLVITQILAGYLDEAEALLDWGRQKAAAGEVYDAHQLSSLARGRIALIRGDATAAVRLLSSAVSAPTALISLEEAWAWALLAEARALRGDSRGADEAMTLSDSARHRGSARYAADIERSRIWVAAARGEMRRAAELAREAAAFARDDRDRPIELWAWHDLARLGYEAEACEPLQELAKKVASRWAPLFDSHCRALVGRDPDELLRCADDFESIGAMLLAAEAAAEAAAALSRAGSRRWTFAAARAERLKGRCPGTLTPALRGAPAVARLSKRQREVALLASLGLSSPEIAQRLFLSTRTVESHLQSAYERLGVANRSELAAVLHAAPITDTRGYEEPRHTDQPC